MYICAYIPIYSYIYVCARMRSCVRARAYAGVGMRACARERAF